MSRITNIIQISTDEECKDYLAELIESMPLEDVTSVIASLDQTKQEEIAAWCIPPDSENQK